MLRPRDVALYGSRLTFWKSSSRIEEGSRKKEKGRKKEDEESTALCH